MQAKLCLKNLGLPTSLLMWPPGPRKLWWELFMQPVCEWKWIFSTIETLLGLESSKNMMLLFSIFCLLSEAGKCTGILQSDGPQTGVKPKALCSWFARFGPVVTDATPSVTGPCVLEQTRRKGWKCPWPLQGSHSVCGVRVCVHVVCVQASSKTQNLLILPLRGSQQQGLTQWGPPCGHLSYP